MQTPDTGEGGGEMEGGGGHDTQRPRRGQPLSLPGESPKGSTRGKGTMWALVGRVRGRSEDTGFTLLLLQRGSDELFSACVTNGPFIMSGTSASTGNPTRPPPCLVPRPTTSEQLRMPAVPRALLIRQ